MPLLFQLREDQKQEVRTLARLIGLEKVAAQISATARIMTKPSPTLKLGSGCVARERRVRMGDKRISVSALSPGCQLGLPPR